MSVNKVSRCSFSMAIVLRIIDDLNSQFHLVYYPARHKDETRTRGNSRTSPMCE
jgi:hypothetical protein